LIIAIAMWSLIVAPMAVSNYSSYLRFFELSENRSLIISNKHRSSAEKGKGIVLHFMV
jgi:hypothetical protein